MDHLTLPHSKFLAFFLPGVCRRTDTRMPILKSPTIAAEARFVLVVLADSLRAFIVKIKFIKITQRAIDITIIPLKV